MAIKTVNFGVLHPDGTAWVGAILRFEQSADDWTATEQYPADVVVAVKTDADGNGSVPLWDNEAGLAVPQPFFTCTLPSGETFPFTVPTSGDPHELGTLRNNYTAP